MAPRVKDITGTTVNGFKVLSYKGLNTNKRPRHVWEVMCKCGRVLTMTKCSLNKNLSGCGSCLNSYCLIGDMLLVDVSTESHPNTYTILDSEKEVLLKNARWYAYEKSGTTSLYVRTNNPLYEGKDIHAVVNGTPRGYHTDHISGDTLDNRSSNLRTVTLQENTRNCRLSKNNTSGFRGISLTPKGVWRAYITVDRRQIHLGHFSDKVSAIVARVTAEMLYDFHENHGRVM